jgi:hypothetical protein
MAVLAKSHSQLVKRVEYGNDSSSALFAKWKGPAEIIAIKSPYSSLFSQPELLPIVNELIQRVYRT